MGAAGMCARCDLARRWGQLLVLAIVVGVAGTIVFAGFAGARRTASSFDRFAESTRAYDVLVFFSICSPLTVNGATVAPERSVVFPYLQLQPAQAGRDRLILSKLFSVLLATFSAFARCGRFAGINPASRASPAA